MLIDLLAQQVAVCLGAARHEGCPKAGGEGRLRFGHAPLGARDLGGEARQEVIHRLRRGQPRNRRQHAKRIAGEHDDVVRLPTPRRVRGV